MIALSRKALVVLMALCALAAAPAFAETYEVSAAIQPDQGITESQTIRLIIQAKGQGRPSIASPQIRGLKNVRVISGPDSAFNSVWTNGRYSTTTQLVYTLITESPGPAEIPPLTVQIDGRSYETKAMRFDVDPAPTGRPPPPSSASSGGNTPIQDRADVYTRAQIGSEDVWLGESVPLTILLYSNEDISQPDFVSRPSLDSFWVEEVNVEPNSERYQAMVEGRKYSVYPFSRQMLVPQAAGKIEIEPFVMQIPVRMRRSSDPFEFFSLRRSQRVVRKTQPITLRVRPLPTEGRPDEFSGAVGRYTLKVSVDREEAQVNDAVALTATVEGEGFLRSVSPPVFEGLPDIKVFDPKVSSVSRNVKGRLVSRKTWEWVLVPLAPGDLALPDVRFHYFDTTDGAYRLASQQLPRLAVHQGDRVEDSATAHGDIQLQRRDLAFIKPLRGQLKQASPRAHRRGVFLGLAFLPLALGPVFVYVGRHRARLQQNRGLARSRRARTRTIKRLKAVRKRLDDGDSAAFHEEIARALVGYVADRFNRSSAGLTYDLADELLASKGLDADLRRNFRSCLETCDFARFVPASAGADRRSELLDEAQELMHRIESAW